VVFPEKPLHDCPHIRISLLGTGGASTAADVFRRRDQGLQRAAQLPAGHYISSITLLGVLKYIIYISKN